MSAKPKGRTRQGTHKKVVHRNGLFICVSEKCGATANTSEELKSLIHVAVQNHEPRKQAKAAAAQAKEIAQETGETGYAYT